MTKKVLGLGEEQPGSLAGDIKAHALTSAINGIKTSSDNTVGSTRVFGHDGVGGITCDKVCVKVDGWKGEVWLSDGLYVALSRKVREEKGGKEDYRLLHPFKNDILDKLKKPEELMQISVFAPYAPLFNAISNCGMPLTDVNAMLLQQLEDLSNVLGKEFAIVSERKTSGFTGKSIKEFGTGFVLAAMERYNNNKLSPAQAEKPAEKEVQREEESRYAFPLSSMRGFYTRAMKLPRDQRDAFFEIGRHIEQEGSITEQGGLEIFSNYHKEEPERIFGRRFSEFIFSGCLEVVGKGKPAREVSAKIQEVPQKEKSITPPEKIREAAPKLEIIEKPVTETAAQGYTFAEKNLFKTYTKNIGEMRSGEGKALEQIGKVIEGKGAISESEFAKIYQAHGASGSEKVLEYLVRNDMLKKVGVVEEEAAPKLENVEKSTEEATALPAKEIRLPSFTKPAKLVQPPAAPVVQETPPAVEKVEVVAKEPEVKLPTNEELCSKLLELFKKMDEKVTDSGFHTERVSLRVFGFRARKGIIMNNRACIDIAVDVNSGEGKAWVHLERSLANMLVYSNALPTYNALKDVPGLRIPSREHMEGSKPSTYIHYEDILREETQEKLRGKPEFNDFISILDFLRRQKITPSIHLMDTTEWKFFDAVANKYKTASRIKWLRDGGSTAETAVSSFSSSTSLIRTIEELRMYGMNEEAGILEVLWRKSFGSTSLNFLADKWSKEVPQNEKVLAVSLDGNTPEETKKFITTRIAENRERIKTASKELEDLLANEQSAPNQGWFDYWHRDAMDKRAELHGATTALANLEKTYEMLEKYGGVLKELSAKAAEEKRVEPEALTPAIPAHAPLPVRMEVRPYAVSEILQEAAGEKTISEIAAREGLKEEDMGQCMRRCTPAKAEKIIEICKRYNFDWKNHQSVFISPMKNLEPNLSLCSHNNVDPSQLGLVVALGYQPEMFANFLKSAMTGKGLHFRDLSEQAPPIETPRPPIKEVLPVATGLGEEKVKRPRGRPKGVPTFTPEEVERRREDTRRFCNEKGIDIEHHPILYTRSLRNLTNIVEDAEHEKLPFKPYSNFLSTAHATVNTNIKTLKWYNSQPVEFKLEPKDYTWLLVLPVNNLRQNLETCIEDKRDPVKEGFIHNIGMNPGDFGEFLKDFKPEKMRLTPEERRKMVIDITAKHGMSEDKLSDHIKKSHPLTVEKIIEVSNKHGWDWKVRQEAFYQGPAALDWKLGLCEINKVNYSEISMVNIALSKEDFRELIKTMKGSKFKDLETNES